VYIISLDAYRARRDSGIRRASVKLERIQRSDLCACGKHEINATERVAMERGADGKPTGRVWGVRCWLVSQGLG
jgi:hypothetical protein